MLSFEVFRMLIVVIYAWFVIGAGVIGVFAAKELTILVCGRKKEKIEERREVKYEV